MTGIGGNVKIEGYITIKWNLIDMNLYQKTYQVNWYYMPVLGETWLMLSQSYFSMERGSNITFTMDTMELIFKYGGKFIVRYDLWIDAHYTHWKVTGTGPGGRGVQVHKDSMLAT